MSLDDKNSVDYLFIPQISNSPQKEIESWKYKVAPLIINIISDEVHRLVNKVIKIIPRIFGNCMQRSLIIYQGPG